MEEPDIKNWSLTFCSVWDIKSEFHFGGRLRGCFGIGGAPDFLSQMEMGGDFRKNESRSMTILWRPAGTA